MFQENNENYKIDIKVPEIRFAIRIVDSGFAEFGPLQDERETFGNCTTEPGYTCPNPNELWHGACTP